MKRIDILQLRYLGVLLVVSLLLLTVLTALAQSGGAYDLTWNTLDGGGGTSQGGVYSLRGTIGQPDAGSASGVAYSLDSGFWVKGILEFIEHLLHLPLVLR